MLHTASDTVTRTRWRHREAGPFFRSGSLTVGRWAHAYREGQVLTLCALPLDVLHWRPFTDVDFTAVVAADRCPACTTLAGLD
jgi:hypothetical protein